MVLVQSYPLTAVTYNDRGFEAYGTFEEEVNPIVPFGRTLPTLLIPINEDTDEFTILAPNNQAGKYKHNILQVALEVQIVILLVIQV